MTYDTISDDKTIVGNGEEAPTGGKGTPMDRSIGDGPTLRPKEERGGRGAFAPGDVIAGRYVVEKVLGEGGMGIVYQCLDKVGGVSVAVKCLPPEVSRNEDEMDDIRANYRLVSDLHHPNIACARTLEVDVSTGDYYLVMDLARGTSLKRWMKRNPQATMATKLAILRQVAAALDYAHTRKVIHRDVKPENVMVDDEGVVKVLDFGLAAQIRSSQSRTSAAVTSRGGTPGYKSPEQWRGKPQREPADVYSFGVMAYWMFAGALPFDGDDPVVLGHAVLTEPVEPITGLLAHMNAALVKALAKEPEDRFPSCTAFMDALEGKVGARVSRARTGGSRSRATAKIVLAVAALALAAAGGWWYYRQGQVREQSRLVAEAQEKVGREVAERIRQVAARVQAENESRERADAEARERAEKEARERTEKVARERAEKEARERERRAKWRKEGEAFTVNDPYGLYMTMNWCPAGSFKMGSPATEEGRYDNERQHRVTLTKGFWMGETEVTQGQWKKIMDGETIVDLARKGLQDDTEYMIAGKKQTLRDFWRMDRYGDPNSRCGDLNDNIPVYNVNWHEAVEFCRRLTQRERAEGRIPDGYEYRLPTEAEWEYACRARTTTSLPNGRDGCILGKNFDPALDDIAWYAGNSSVGFQGRGVDTSTWPEKQYPGGCASSREVKGKQPNRWGLYDMIGNVWEWCGDWYDGNYPYGSATDPTGAVTGAYRVMRGGGWNGSACGCRSAVRAGPSPGVRDNSLGFRVALAPSH